VYADPLERALYDACDFRGDVTISTRGGRRHTGYLFNVTKSYVQYFPTEGAEAVSIPRAEIVAVEKTGRDTADGRSWEAWVKKWRENKERIARGEPGRKIDLEAEALA
jgi:hypothetical protein